MSYNPDSPKYEWGSSWKKQAISEKQYAMIERLAAELKITIASDLNILSRGAASFVIDRLSDAKRNGGDQGQWRHHDYNDLRRHESNFKFEVQS
jgi:hypothetical protein